MSSLAITGASGFIGQVVAAHLAAQFHRVIALSRRPLPGLETLPWHLGDPLPDACPPLDAVIHLASAALVARDDMDAAVDADITGTAILTTSIRQRRASGAPTRLIFLSSQSAHPAARNAYGRSKYAIEQALGQDHEIIVRPGLVYDEAGGSVFGLFAKLARLPALPVLAGPAAIQPLHVLELAETLRRLVDLPAPAKLYSLGAITPLSFADAVQATARRLGRRAPLGVPVPAALVRWAAGMVDRLLRPMPPLLERIDGLLALQPMDTAPSLQALRITLAPFAPKHG